MTENFLPAELSELRSELLAATLDSRQTAEVLQMFLIGRGFGISRDSAIEAAIRVGRAGLSLNAIRQELEQLALVM